MRWLEIRRHSLTKKGPARGSGSHLSQAGVNLAGRIGRQVGLVDYLAAGTVPRTLETALAMGYAVDELVDWDGGIPVRDEVPHHAQWEWERPFETYAELIRAGGKLAALAGRQAEQWTRLVERVPEGGVALAISHGGVIEPGMVACLPTAAHAEWGRPFAHLEGARLGYDAGAWCSIAVRRVASDVI
jgi:broad specificity phosphatase PhoE